MSGPYPEYMAYASEDTVIGDVKSPVRVNGHSARRIECALGDLSSRAVRGDANQRTGPVVENKSIEQPVLGEFQYIQRSIRTERHIDYCGKSTGINLWSPALCWHSINVCSADREWEACKLANVVMSIRSERDRRWHGVHRNLCAGWQFKERRGINHS